MVIALLHSAILSSAMSWVVSLLGVGVSDGNTIGFDVACTRTYYHPGFRRYLWKELLISCYYLCSCYFRVSTGTLKKTPLL